MLELTIENMDSMAIIHIKGDCDLKNIPVIEDYCNTLLDKSFDTIAIDCYNLERIDSTAIGFFVKFFNATSNKNIKLIFYDLSSVIEEIFKKACLNRFFTITTKSGLEREFLRIQ